MMWPARPLTPPPNYCDKRTRRRFALIPRRVDDDDPQPMWVWLGWYCEQQEYAHYGYGYSWRTIARYSERP